MAVFDPNNWNTSLQNNFALRSGILLIAEVGSVSFIAVTILLVISICNAIKHYRRHGGWGSSLQPVSLLFLIAMFMDRQVWVCRRGGAIANSVEQYTSHRNIFSARWAFNGKVTEGSYCATQAVMKQIGEGGAGWFTTAIAVMTFVQTMFPGKLNRSQAHWLAMAMIVFIFLFLSLTITLPAMTIPHYYGDTGAWCWISDTSRGGVKTQDREATVKSDRRRHREAIAMLWYPIAYTAEVFPISLVRFLQWDPKAPRVHHGYIILAALLPASSGVINVLLWLLTGRRFGFSDPHEGDEEEDCRQVSYMMHMLSPVPGRTLPPVSGGMLSPGGRGLHFRAATAGGEWHFSQPSFPEDPPVAHRVCIPEPYEWMPSRERELGL
ncbi:hypothetical protein BS47DRAFT_1392552 [Hydnum rufescens UP504]|uniref:Glucose receptor Git3 N-terminal domain-containing protein n=1 Tax=Hydnum rufescens UP504 TaxID=1448309 RepID=A0A9P6AZL3_9AGAM|nr:hypothetical protein BS47DRAFT_1392552 [Hydnum rufescens UP504]